MSQPSLLDEIPTLPKFTVEFLAGFVAQTVFGASPTKAQRQQAETLAEEIARQIAALKAGGSA